MSKLSVLIPTRNERFLIPTVDDLFAKATGDIEVIVNMDGPPVEPLKERPGLHVIYCEKPIGMRQGINSCATIATGEYLMKCDAHCMFAEGFDEVLLAECDEDWVVVPRRHSLDPINWTRIRKRAPKDYHYLSCPLLEGEKGNLRGRVWDGRRRERAGILLDDEMTSQGSCYVMSKRHYWDFLGGLKTNGYGDFIQEMQEVGMKTWLGGGQVKVNKKTWYAHLHKGKTYGRGYTLSRSSFARGLAYSTDLWTNNRWDDRVHDFDWLIDKFWPVPTWPDDWREQLGYC